MNIQKIDINRLQPAPYNPRVELKESDPEYQHIRNSILNFEYAEPIVWNEVTGYIVSGHQRARVLKDLGYTEVEVNVVHIESDAKEKAMNMAMNKAVGLWDFTKLDDLLNEMQDTEWDMADFGFADDITPLVHEPEEDDFDVDGALEQMDEPTVKRGQIWRLGNHYLMCGDATCREEVERLMSAGEEK